MGPENYIGTMGCFAGTFAPRDTALCLGQIIPIVEFTSLYSIIGDAFGGDGRITFGLPDMRGRTPVGVGLGPGLTAVFRGQTRGVEEADVPLPLHDHLVYASLPNANLQVDGMIYGNGGKVVGNASLHISNTTFSGSASVSGTAPVSGTTPVTLNGFLAINNQDGALPSPQINGALAKATAGGTPVNMFDAARTPDDVPGAFVSVSGDIPATGKTVDGSAFSVDTSGLSVSVDGYAQTDQLDVDIENPAFQLYVAPPDIQTSCTNSGVGDAKLKTIPPQTGLNWLIAQDGIYPPRP